MLRISGALTKVNYSTGVGLLALSWDPSALTDFTTLAGLFTEYRVANFKIDFVFPPVVSTTDWTIAAYIVDDPTSLVSETFPGIAQADGVTRLKSFGTAITHTSKVKLARGDISTPVPDGKGFLPVDAAFPGRTLVISESANAASTALAFAYLPTWTLEFRVRV
jgi:hypothetical protein